VREAEGRGDEEEEGGALALASAAEVLGPSIWRLFKTKYGAAADAVPRPPRPAPPRPARPRGAPGAPRLSAAGGRALICARGR
jgi:hypothetical protein